MYYIYNHNTNKIVGKIFYDEGQKKLQIDADPTIQEQINHLLALIERNEWLQVSGDRMVKIDLSNPDHEQNLANTIFYQFKNIYAINPEALAPNELEIPERFS